MYDDRMAFKTFFFIFVLAVSIAFAAPLSEYGDTLNTGSPLNVNGSENGTVSNTPTPTPTTAPAATATPSTGGGGGTTTDSTPAPTSAPAATPEPTAVPVTVATPVPVVVFSTPIPVTEEDEKEEIVEAIKKELKIENAKNTDITKIAEAKAHEEVVSVAKVEQAIQAVTDTKAKEALTEIRNSISSGSSSGIIVNKKVEVFNVKEKTTGENKKVSRITVEFKPTNTVKDVKIVEVIPKSTAASIIDILFPGEKPEVLQADPVVQWKFAEVKAGESKDLSYIVNKEIKQIETSTVASISAAPAATATPAPAPAAPDMTGVYIIVVLIIAAAAYMLIFNKKNSTISGIAKKFKYEFKR